MQTANPRVLKNLIHKYLAPFIVEQTIDLPLWHSYTAVHKAPGVNELTNEPAVDMKLGERYLITYDDTRFFEASVTVPQSFAGRKCYLSIDFGGESIVKINGKIVGALSSRCVSGWEGREEILFSEPFQGGEVLNIQIETALDCGYFCDRMLGGETHAEHTLAKAQLQVINEDAQGLYYDMTTAFSVYENSEDRYAAKRLYNAIDNCMHKLDFDLGRDAFYASVPGARKYFWDKVSEIKTATPGEVLLAGHSHLDIAWLWTTNEITRKCCRTFSNNLALMDCYPDFRFTQSQACAYYFVKRYYPEVFERIKEKVKNGQWEITGNTWVEADTNIASGESLIRQLLVGREFFLKEFGVSSDIYWLPDCFGFTAALPQIIKRSGMKYFVTSKLQNNDTNEFPMSVFKWRSHSGDEILAYMQKVSYQGEADAPYVVRTRSTNRQNDIVDASMGMFGYGDGGGGCTYCQVERERRLEKLPGMPRVRMGKAAEFFAQVEKNADELPVWDGEMYYENHRGTYTSQAFIKKNNRRGEFKLRELEMLALLTGHLDRERLAEMWQLLLTNQFHDILPGTSIHQAVEDTRKDYERLNALMDAYEQELFDALLPKIGKKGQLAVFNFLPFTADNTVKVPVAEHINGVSDTAGNEMASRIIYDNGVRCLEFTALSVPQMGYKLFELTDKPYITVANKPEGVILENEYLLVEFDKNLLIDRIYDKENRREVLTGKGNLLTVSHDKPIHESAWNLESDYRMHMTELTSVDSFDFVPFNGVMGEVTVKRTYHLSTVTQKIQLRKGARTLDFITDTDWHEREKVLKAQFPVSVRARYSTYEIAHGALERPTYANNSYEQAMFEGCAHKWTDLSDGSYGVSLLNDCKYGYDIFDNLMRITLMRGPIVPDPLGDIGKNSFTYSLYPHACGWNDAQTVQNAFKLNVPFIAKVALGEQEKPCEHSFMTINRENIVLDAVKPALDNDGIIIRVYEAQHKQTDVTLTLPYENARVFECNLMEENELPVVYQNNGFGFTIKPYEVKSFRVVTE